MSETLTGPVTIDLTGLQTLMETLSRQGYALIAPVLRDDAIVYDEIDGVDDLPKGWADDQSPGRYRLKERDDDALFGYAVGPQSWRRYLHPPLQRLWSAQKGADGITITEESLDQQKRAFIGVRACELSAMQIQDKVFCGEDYKDAHYKSRRDNALIISVNCSDPSDVCFCTSMGTGPAAKQGFDLSLTELMDREEHLFLLEAGTQAGLEIMQALPHRATTPEEASAGAEMIENSVARMGRTLQTNGLRDLLMRNLENAHWDDVAQRCLSCSNCTMVCPTCFCTSVEDTSDLSGQNSERSRRWDSCFTMDHSYLTGGSVHKSTSSRYRQWLTHKLATWEDQFGESGCVGCGRCIAWCPAGIDITEEIAAIRKSESLTGEDAG